MRTAEEARGEMFISRTLRFMRVKSFQCDPMTDQTNRLQRTFIQGYRYGGLQLDIGRWRRWWCVVSSLSTINRFSRLQSGFALLCEYVQDTIYFIRLCVAFKFKEWSINECLHLPDSQRRTLKRQDKNLCYWRFATRSNAITIAICYEKFCLSRDQLSS